MNYDKLEFKPANEFWNEAKNELGYSWMDVYVNRGGVGRELIASIKENITVARGGRPHGVGSV
jgi:hypothetical protein